METLNKDEDLGIVAQALLVEDDTFLVELLALKLKQSKIKTFFAVDAAKARSILAEEKIDIILLDIVLPGMDGLTFLKELQEGGKIKSIPVIIISNLWQKEKAEEALEYGAAHYFIKAHVTIEEIISKVLELIKKK